MIDKYCFGKTRNGENVDKYILSNGSMSVSILTYGATIQSIIVPSLNGDIDVALGYNTVKEYEDNSGYLGATVGRNINRIAKGKFKLYGVEYNLDLNDKGIQNLHGGNDGFSNKVFKVVKADSHNNVLEMEYFSKNLESGFPGDMFFYVTFTLTKDNGLKLDYLAKADKNTVCNISNHSYFNLNGENCDGAHDAILTIDADFYTPSDENLIPTGEIRSVKGTPFDFTEPKKINRDIHADNQDIRNQKGYDVNFVLKNNGEFAKIVTAYSEKTGVLMETYTDQPGVQLYTGAYLDVYGKSDMYKPNNSFCLETQKYPNSINTPHFPSVILKTNEKYHASTEYKFSVIKENK